MELDLDVKNILEMRMIKECIRCSNYSDVMKKQLTDFIDEVVVSLNKENKIEINIIVDTSSEEEIDDEAWEE
tara:strand:- start:172 stop:387 length:216 start_codon:yes stop_codon:yes gene_type:complete